MLQEAEGELTCARHDLALFVPPSSLPSCLRLESCSASPARLGGQELTGLFVRMTGIGITSFLLIRTGGLPEVFCSVSQICYS